MGCKAGQCNETSLPWYVFFIVAPSLERWSAKLKEAPSLHEVRLTPLDSTRHQPIISMSWGKKYFFKTPSLGGCQPKLKIALTVCEIWLKPTTCELKISRPQGQSDLPLRNEWVTRDKSIVKSLPTDLILAQLVSH